MKQATNDTDPQQEAADAEDQPDVSIKEVARLAGVSIATVSRCINKPDKVTAKTRLKVQDAIRQTGYSPNTLGAELSTWSHEYRYGGVAVCRRPVFFRL